MMMQNVTDSDLLVVEQQGALLVLRLNRPAALNALNRELIQALSLALKQAFADDSVQTLWLESTSHKAFCAGGDVKQLVQRLMGKPRGEQRQLGHDYFQAEYHLDALIAESPKPIVAWAQGWVLGGGWGLFAGCDWRLASVNTHFAMPEVGIGFFPDVGAAHFLQQPDWRVGTFLAISGITLNSTDTAALGYVDALLAETDILNIQQSLAEGTGLADVKQQHAAMLPATERLAAWQEAVADLPMSPLADWLVHINSSSFAPFQQASRQWQQCSPLSVALTWYHFKRLRGASRTAVLQQDLQVASHACTEQEFIEGVRASLIDKDQQPHWLYPAINTVPFTLIERFY